MNDEFTDPEVPTEADLDQCYGSKYLSAQDIGDKKVRTRIKQITKEKMRQQDGKERQKFVLHFATDLKPMVLNSTNKDILVEELGKKPADWIGPDIGIFSAPTTFGGKPTRGLRLKVLPTATTKAAPPPPPPPPSTDDMRDEIPF